MAGELGAGTIFTIYLPAVVIQAPQAASLPAQDLPQGHGECEG